MKSMEYNVTEEDLNWLAAKGHSVDRIPIVLEDGRKSLYVDGVSRTEEQIANYIRARAGQEARRGGRR